MRGDDGNGPWSTLGRLMALKILGVPPLPCCAANTAVREDCRENVDPGALRTGALTCARHGAEGCCLGAPCACSNLLPLLLPMLVCTWVELWQKDRLWRLAGGVSGPETPGDVRATGAGLEGCTGCCAFPAETFGLLPPWTAAGVVNDRNMT